MSQSTLDTDRVAQLLLQDAVPTLGERAREELRRLVANYKALAGEWMLNGDSLAEAQRSFDRAVIDGLQQSAHDLFWDTTWPACPLHSRHPLWYDEDQQAWCCAEAGAVVAPLGELASLRPPAT